jgi:ArsR family transcriptional regulator, arsenate/arsenite/antimonite-responsive transcriptional repressor
MFSGYHKVRSVKPISGNGAFAPTSSAAVLRPVCVRGSDDDDIIYANRDFVVDELLSINHSRFMDDLTAITIMSALAQPTRLRTFRLLIEHGEEGLASGAIASAVGAPQNTMSSHLTILTHAKLVEREQRGRSVTYRARMDDVADLQSFLLLARLGSP